MSIPNISGMMPQRTPASSLISQTAQASQAPQAAKEKNSELPAAKEAIEAGHAEVTKAAASVEKFIKAQSNTQLQFSVDKDTSLNVVKVVDTVTNEVLTQIPSKEVLAMAQAIDKLEGLMSMKGVLLSNRQA